MPTIRFDLNEEYCRKLQKAADDAKMNVQDYIRFKLFNEKTLFTVEEVVTRIENTKPTDPFTIPDLFTDEEWINIDSGKAGVLGKNFFQYIEKHPEKGIHLLRGQKIKGRAAYIYEKF